MDSREALHVAEATAERSALMDLESRGSNPRSCASFLLGPVSGSFQWPVRALSNNPPVAARVAALTPASFPDLSKPPSPIAPATPSICAHEISRGARPLSLSMPSINILPFRLNSLLPMAPSSHRRPLSMPFRAFVTAPELMKAEMSLTASSENLLQPRRQGDEIPAQRRLNLLSRTRERGVEGCPLLLSIL